MGRQLSISKTSINQSIKFYLYSALQQPKGAQGAFQ